MKKTAFLLTLALVIACKQQPKKIVETVSQISNETLDTEKIYPEALINVFKAHGGLELWRQQRTLAYDMPSEESSETHIIDLWSRKDRIAMGDVAMGHDGDKTWLLDPNNEYKGDANFYHNLMFYFYAMPFVLADDGINYGETEPLEFEGKSYPGIQITYESGVGTSPKDEYYLHYDPETFQMAWLGYTVTYRTGEDSDNIKWIRYDDWTTIDGLKLPKSISWYNYEGKQIKDLRKNVPFENISLSTEPKDAGFYDKPEEAEYVTGKE